MHGLFNRDATAETGNFSISEIIISGQLSVHGSTHLFSLEYIDVVKTKPQATALPITQTKQGGEN